MSRNRKLEELIEINTAISSRLDSRDLLKSITLSALALLDADSAEVWLLEEPARKTSGGSDSPQSGPARETDAAAALQDGVGSRLPVRKQYRFRLLASAGTSDPLTADSNHKNGGATVLTFAAEQIESDDDRSFLASGLDGALAKALGGPGTGGYRPTRAESAFFAFAGDPGTDESRYTHGLFTVSREEPRPFQGDDYYFLEKLAIQTGISLSTSQRFEHVADERDQALANLAQLKERSLVGGSEAMREVQRLIQLAAPSRASVLILGERGVGKELIADALHRGSERAQAPFIKLNCAGLVESLLESELFGYEKGAFTGADQDRAGLLEAADGGTLFLDEVGEMSPGMQAKLLRFLQEGTFRRVGSQKQERKVDVRVVAATNRDIAGDGDGLMRRDLFDRLATIVLRIPALRERREDIAALMQHFLKRYTRLENKSGIEGFSPEIFALMEAADWPGNVRELENAVHRLVILHSTGSLIQNTDQVFVARRQGVANDNPQVTTDPSLETSKAGDGAARPGTASAAAGDSGPDTPPQSAASSADAPDRIYFEAKDAFEADYIRRALAATRGNISKAAQLSGLDRGNFRLKMNKHEVDAAEFKSKKK